MLESNTKYYILYLIVDSGDTAVCRDRFVRETVPLNETMYEHLTGILQTTREQCARQCSKAVLCRKFSYKQTLGHCVLFKSRTTYSSSSSEFTEDVDIYKRLYWMVYLPKFVLTWERYSFIYKMYFPIRAYFTFTFQMHIHLYLNVKKM